MESKRASVDSIQIPGGSVEVIPHITYDIVTTPTSTRSDTIKNESEDGQSRCTSSNSLLQPTMYKSIADVTAAALMKQRESHGTVNSVYNLSIPYNLRRNTTAVDQQEKFMNMYYQHQFKSALEQRKSLVSFDPRLSKTDQLRLMYAAQLSNNLEKKKVHKSDSVLSALMSVDENR